MDNSGATASRRDWRLPLVLMLVALVTLMVELLLIRVLEVIMRPELGHAVITCALFAFSVSGVYATIRPLRGETPPTTQVAPIALLLSLALLLLRPAMNALPLLYSGIPWAPVRLLVAGGSLYLILLIPFFLSGLLFAYLFSAYPGRIRNLYFWDLGGAAVGSVLFIPFLRPIGPGGLLLWGSALSLLAFGLLIPVRRRQQLAFGIAVLLVVVPTLRTDGYLDFLLHQDKRGVATAQAEKRIEFTEWDPISRIDVIPAGEHVLHVAYDGGSQSSSIYRFDGDYAALREALEGGTAEIGEHFWHRGVLASHYLKRDQDAHVLIIGSAAGQETKAALLYGAARVDGVELVKTVVDIGRDRYQTFNGGLFLDPRVSNVAGEGRSYLRSTEAVYDVIQIHSNHTSSYVAAGIGGATPVYLQTVEAYEEYFSHLTDEGILHYNHYFYPRMVVTAARAWRNLGRDDFRSHVLVFGNERDLTLPTVLIKMSPWTAAEVADAKAFFSMQGDTTHPLVVDPLDPRVGFLTDEFFSGEFPQALQAEMDYWVTPATDDKPFFSHIQRHLKRVEVNSERFLDAAMVSAINGRASSLGGEYTTYLGIGALGVFFGLLLVGLPLKLSAIGRAEWAMKSTSLLYFSLLGLGFIVIELTLIQMLMRLLGFPLYTYSVVIFTMLLAAGCGSLLADVFKIGPDRLWWLPFVGVLLSGLSFVVAHEMLIDSFLPFPLFVRIAAAAVMIVPIGFFLGMPFPMGVLRLHEEPPGAVAWAWGANGLFTVVGGVATGLTSMSLGFQSTFMLALGVYGIAMLVMARLRERRPA